MFDQNRFNIFLSILKDSSSQFNIKYKNESILMAILKKILFFNDFDKFITTIGSTVYFQSKEYVEQHPRESAVVLSHEYVHARDSKKLTHILFGFLYLIPQILFLPTIIIGIVYKLPFLIALSFLFLLPLPAYFRMLIERRGYLMSLFAINEVLKESSVPAEDRKNILIADVKHMSDTFFKGWPYYRMWPWGISNYLESKIDDIVSEDILNDKAFYFQDIKGAFKNSKYD